MPRMLVEPSFKDDSAEARHMGHWAWVGWEAKKVNAKTKMIKEDFGRISMGQS